MSTAEIQLHQEPKCDDWIDALLRPSGHNRFVHDNAAVARAHLCAAYRALGSAPHHALVAAKLATLISMMESEQREGSLLSLPGVH